MPSYMIRAASHHQHRHMITQAMERMHQNLDSFLVGMFYRPSLIIPCSHLIQNPQALLAIHMEMTSQELDYSITETMGQFSPQFDELADSSDHTPLRNPSPITMASSSSKMRDMAIISQLRLYPGNGHLSSGCSLHWRSSPITPLTRLGETKTQDSGCGLYDILEDDTPEIFKESPTPVTSVKSSSPLKKRVSPPHGRIQEFQSSSSAGLKSGRKFVLKSVPSFPPLTPCIDPTDRTQQRN
ncbi:protein tesmin/TSO1 CXC [Salix suchowensis]|nr:protein tesmin/TSO1 CXC [Salix suchowensis]